MRIVIVANCSKPKVRQAVDELVPWMKEHSDVVGVDTDATLGLQKVDADAILIFGGDGTLLSTARRLQSRPIAMMGVNFGRLGFLASFTPGEFKDQFEKLVARKLPVSSRLVLEASVVEADVKCSLGDPRDV